jgi:hypothetical protein
LLQHQVCICWQLQQQQQQQLHRHHQQGHLPSGLPRSCWTPSTLLWPRPCWLTWACSSRTCRSCPAVTHHSRPPDLLA